VEGTPVYGADDRKIGTVQRVMIDKISGKVAYAVISFGGFLGMGEDYYPMPWAALRTTPILAATVLALPTISSKALQNIPQTPNGIGQTAAETKPSTTIIARRCGTFDVTRRLGVFGSAFFQVRLYVRQPAGSPAAPEDGQIHRWD
jgi:hypothetical protein